MSQFLDCFSEEEVTSILTRAARSMSGEESPLYHGNFLEPPKV